jgi:LRR receptor-like serine/threonine-protein kinase FLS2
MMGVVDSGLLRTKSERDVIVMQSILLPIMELGLKCSKELPNESIAIKEVLAKLNKIKLTLFENRNRGI